MNGAGEYKHNLFAFSDVLSWRFFRFTCYKCHLMPPFPQAHLFLLQTPQASAISKCEIHTRDHRLGDVQSHNGREYLLHEQRRPQGLAARGEHRDVWSTVPQLLLPLCTRCSWGTDCRAVGQECVGGSPEGKKGSSSSTNVWDVAWQYASVRRQVLKDLALTTRDLRDLFDICTVWRNSRRCNKSIREL